MVFIGLSVQIARFHNQSRRGAYGQDKYTCAGTLAKMGGGLMRKRGVWAGFYDNNK